jgi:lambda repressor-like predicted transcriptional regulator
MELRSRLPADPLKQAIIRKKQLLDLTWEELGCRLGVTERTLQRVMTHKWIGPYAADHMALRLGLHPSNLWPNEWGAASGRGSNRTRKGETWHPKQRTA